MFGRLSWNRTKDEEQETDMNKIITVAILSSGLLLLDAPEAAAHEEVRVYYPASHYGGVRHVRHMPRWLKRDKAFRHWYKHTRLRRHRHLTWHRLFEIYRWETIERRKHRRADRYYRSHDVYRRHDRDRKRRHGH